MLALELFLHYSPKYLIFALNNDNMDLFNKELVGLLQQLGIAGQYANVLVKIDAVLGICLVSHVVNIV